MADWIDPGTRVGMLAAIAIANRGRATALSQDVAERLTRLARSGVHVAVVGASVASAPTEWVGLADDPALCRWVGDLGEEHGVGPGLVAVFAEGPCDPVVEAIPRLRLVHVPAAGELDDLRARLDEQLGHLADGAVPDIDHDPAWVVALERGDTPLVRVDEALGTVADGRIGTRGSYEEDGRTAHELVLANGVYTSGAFPSIMPCPLWTGVELDPVPAPGPRWLDLRTGVLARRADTAPQVRSLRFACLARPGTVALRLEGRLDDTGGPPVRAPEVLPEGVRSEAEAGADEAWAATSSGAVRVVAVGAQRRRREGSYTRLDRLAAYRVAPDLALGRRAAGSALAAAQELGVMSLLVEQRRAWATRWQDADVGIDEDVELTRAVRFAVHHLLAGVPAVGEAAVGARGLTGPAYAGHVFWDADVYVLPVLAAVRPPAARAMLTYRLSRLAEARAVAAAHGHLGACFPWESADQGDDVTPSAVLDADGQVMPIPTGAQSLHITADVAWAAWQYALWTGDWAWLAGPGRDLMVETARFWTSRVEIDADGTGHLRGVVGPDEYHVSVDDDTYTNVLARWNLRAAAELVADEDAPGVAAERDRWLEVADRLVVHHDPVANRHEQFAGFDDLEPLVISTIADLPVAADVLLGRDRVAGAQVVKQPDVLMAHHMVRHELAPGSLEADLDHEGPRLAHGSSLSPAIVAGLLARAGRPGQGEALFRLAARLDLDDVTGTTAGGLHLASMGGVWQALVGGFAGVEPTRDSLVVAPCLPSSWRGVHVTVRYHDVRVRVHARHDEVTVTTTGPVPVRFGRDGDPELVDGSCTRPRAALRPAPVPAPTPHGR